MIECQLDVLSNSAGELKDTQKKQKEGGMDMLLFISWVFWALIVVATVCTIAIWAIVLKETISMFLEEFRLKKTAVVATMALVLLSVATANAGDTIVQIEDGILVYYEKTKEIPGLIPKGITAEQARQLVEGTVPSVKLSAEKTRFYFGFPLTKIKTDTTVLFRNGWVTEGESHESLSAAYLVLVSIFILYGFFATYLNELEMVFAVAVGFLIIAAVAVFLVDTETLKVVGASTVLLSVGGFSGLYLRRKKEKNRGASSEHASVTKHYGHA